MIRNYVFDLGHVLGIFDPLALTSACVDDPHTAQHIAGIVFDRLYWDPLDEGTITDEEVRADICRRLPMSLHEVACQVYDSWVEHMQPVDGMQQLVRDIKNQGGRLYLLSNTTVALGRDYHKSPWMKEMFSLFDGLVLSGVVGLVKPDRAIFEYLLSHYNLKAEETIFVDDNADNIVGCQAVGIRGYLFDGDAAKLREALGIQ